MTAQHRDMLDQMLAQFNVTVDYDLNLMQAQQSLTTILARMLPALENIIRNEQPYAVLAQGDTTTVFGAAFHSQVPFGHIETGLRTHNLQHPFPEEGYRQMVSRITRWHFVPTESVGRDLRQEGIDGKKIYVVGNTCIDTLLQSTQITSSLPSLQEKRLILLTAHRRENFGKPLQNIFAAILQILEQYPDVEVLYPVHPNPNVQQLAYNLLGQQVKPLD